MPKQQLINSPCFGGNQVIRMRDETHKSVFLPNQVELFLPEVNRIVVQYLEERIILSSGKGQFEDLSDKKRHHCAAAAALRLQMGNIWHGHVVGKLVCVVPIEIAVHDSRTEAARAEFLDALINFLGSLEEYLSLLILLPIMT